MSVWEREKKDSEREGFASHSTVICPLWKKNKGQKIQQEQSSCLVTIATERLLSYLAIHYERALVDRVRVGKGGKRGRKRERGRQTVREREEGIFSVLVAGKWSETGRMIQRTDVKYILNRKKKYIEKKNNQTFFRRIQFFLYIINSSVDTLYYTECWFSDSHSPQIYIEMERCTQSLSYACLLTLVKLNILLPVILLEYF